MQISRFHDMGSNRKDWQQQYHVSQFALFGSACTIAFCDGSDPMGKLYVSNICLDVWAYQRV